MSSSPPLFDTDLPSPSFVVDLDVCRSNCERMLARCASQKLGLRPHVKTHKTVEGADLQCGTAPGARDGAKIVVSTLAEAEFFASRGFAEILYGVPFEPSKFGRIWALHASLPAFHVLVDSAEALDDLEAFAAERVAALTSSPAGSGAASDALVQGARRVSAFLAVDATGYHREGVDPATAEALALAVRMGRSRRVKLAGIYSHSGNSYNCVGGQAGAAVVAETERDVMVRFADAVRAAGIDVPVVSLGATPSACSGIEWAPGLELHPGNFLFLDRQQVESGSGSLAEVAVYVLARVIARHPERNEFLIDAGGCALHKDPAGMQDGCWGSLRDDPSLVLRKMTQEVAVVRPRGEEEGVDWARYPLGAVVRVVPNHACMTAACHPVYHVVAGDGVEEGGAGPGRKLVGTWTPAKFW
jgi:D-serine deaminase-like pyridoxal phosphate-dependent protein